MMVSVCKYPFVLFFCFLACSTFYIESSYTQNIECFANKDCGVGTCNTNHTCECPPGYANAPEAFCVKQMEKKSYKTPFLLELFLGWGFPAGFAYEDFWQLAGIRIASEGLAAIFGGSYLYSKFKLDRRIYPISMATTDIHLNDLTQKAPVTIETASDSPPARTTSSTRTKILGGMFIATASIHFTAWLLNTIFWGELQWPDQGVKKLLHQTKGRSADLAVLGSKIVDSVRVTLENFSPDSCALQEGCIKTHGERRLLRFDSYIYNAGDGDFVFAFENIKPIWSPCHGHFHAPEATGYFLKQELFNASHSSQPIRYGHKQGYCFRDTVKIKGDYNGKFSCGIPKMTRQLTQGITAGWADIYYSTLDCQWIDITDIEPGIYQLIFTINPHGVYYQDKPENNLTIVEVLIPPVNATEEKTTQGVKVLASVIKEYNQNN